MSISTTLYSLWRMIVIVAVTLSAVIVALTFTPIFRATNCGGNSSALNKAGCLGNFAICMSMDRPDRVFNFEELTENESSALAMLAHSSWNSSAKFYVAAGDISFPNTARRIIAVCDTPYRNVPERRLGTWLWPAPPTHAAAFSDGTTGLISPEEYERINPSDLIDVKTLVTSSRSSIDSTQPLPDMPSEE